MIKEKTVSEMFIAAQTHHVDDVSDELIEKFTNDFEVHLSEAGAKPQEPQNFFTVFHVDAYRDTDYNMALWMQVETCLPNTDDIVFMRIPESEVSYIIVSENYENLRFAYDALFDYVQDRGYTVNGYPRETYLSDDSAPLGYYTEIQLPFMRTVDR